MNEILDKYLDDWDLALAGNKLETESSILYFVKQDDTLAVLKIYRPDSDEKQMAQILNHYEGCGTVKVLQSSDDAILLERLTPGTQLVELVKDGHDDSATKIFCEVVRQLHSKPVSSTVAGNVVEFKENFDVYLRSDKKEISDKDILNAKNMFVELASTQAQQVLLHGDLHHYNILQDDKYGWLAIDPKGYIGEPEYEIGAFLRNPIENLSFYATKEIIENRLQIVSENLNLDNVRILQWAYAQTVLAISYGARDKECLAGWLQLLKVLQTLI